MKQVPKSYWLILAFSVGAIALALLLLFFSKQNTNDVTDLYPGPLRGQAQLVPLGERLLLSELAVEKNGSGRELFCSLLSPKARLQINLNPHLSCSMPVKEGARGDEVRKTAGALPPTYEAPAKRILVFVRPLEVEKRNARLVAISCAENKDPLTGKKGVFVTRPRFARAQLFAPGTKLAPSRFKDLRVTTPGGVWLVTEFFEELLRKPTRAEMVVSWKLYKEMRQQAPWCPLPRELR